jgi:hypothetical protein
MDGSIKLNDNGEPIDTYSNDDIATFARAWTGFDVSQPRGNIQVIKDDQPWNYVDPMQLKVGWRDQLPKTKLQKGYLGDGFPLCSDLPNSHFLMKGSTYTYTGNVSAFGATFDETEKFGHFTPDAAESKLHAALCKVDTQTGSCTFPVEVILERTLECNGVAECDADDVKVVKVLSADGGVGFYNHIPTRCTRMALFESGTLVAIAQDEWQCIDPLLPGTTGNVCCNNTDGTYLHHTEGTPSTWTPAAAGPNGTNGTNVTTTSSTSTSTTTTTAVPVNQCMFAAETMKLATAEKRCVAAFGAGTGVCAEPNFNSASYTGNCAANQDIWSTKSCHLQVEIQPNGDVSILEPHAALKNYRLAQTTGIKVRVRWNAGDGASTGDSIFPIVENDCGPGCHAIASTCICDVTIDTRLGYSGALPSESDMRDLLTIGAFDPAEYADEVVMPSAVLFTCSMEHVSRRVRAGSSVRGGARIIVRWLVVGSRIRLLTCPNLPCGMVLLTNTGTVRACTR